MKVSKSSQMKLSVVFLLFFILENIWIVRHSGPVLWISEFSVQHLGYWSSRLSYGLPIVFGVLLFILLTIILFGAGVLFLEDETGRPLKQKPTLDDFRAFWEHIKIRLATLRFPIVMIVIGLEFGLLGALKYYEAKSFGPLTECGLQTVVDGQCASRWIKLPVTDWPGGAQVGIEKSSKVFSYVQLDPQWPIFIKVESYRTDEPADLLSHMRTESIEGLIDDIDYSHFVFFKIQGIENPASEIKIISWKENPDHFSFMATVQFVIGFIFAIIGLISYRRQSVKTNFRK